MPVEWYYAKDDQQYGPVNAKELKRLADAGELQPDDLVWRDGMGEWAKANHVKKLFRRVKPPEPELPDLEPPTGSAIPGGPTGPPGSDSEPPSDLEPPASDPLPVAADGTPSTADLPSPTVSDTAPPASVSASGGVPAAPASAFAAAVPTKPNGNGPSLAAKVPNPGVPATGMPVASASSSGAIPPPDSLSPVRPITGSQVSDTHGSIGPPMPSGRTAPVPSPWAEPVGSTPPRVRPQGRHFFDAMLDGIRRNLTPSFIDSFAKVFLVLGYFGLYGAMVAGAVFPVVVKASVVNILAFGTVWILMLLVLQYVAQRFTAVLRRLNREAEGRLSSTAFPDSFAVLATVAGLAALAVLVVLAVRDGMYLLIGAGLAAFLISEYAAMVSLVPASLSIRIVPRTSSSEEAIGVFSFLVKVFARVVPVMFGVGVLYGTTAVLVAEVGSVNSSEPAAVAEPTAEVAFAAWFAGKRLGLLGMILILVFALLPFIGYLVFLAYYLSVNVVRAILFMPGKLDELLQAPEAGEDSAGAAGSGEQKKAGGGEKESGKKP